MLYIKYLVLASVLFFISCSSHKPIDGSNEVFAKNAISISYSSSKKLNLYNGESHVIPLVVYQLNNINSFNGLKKDKQGIVKLLGAKKFDKSVMSVSKFFIAPNETKTLYLDRATRAAWVCLVAGYYNMQPSQSTLQAQTPAYNAWNIFKSKENQKMLKLKIHFDKSSIEQEKE